jgi:FkbM family methyltransferase
MGFPPRLRSGLLLLRNALVLRDWEYGMLLARLGMPPWGFSATQRGLQVRELGILIPRESSSLIPCLGDALCLKRMLGVNFSSSQEGIIATAGRLRFHITSGEELYILREILWDGVYNFGVPLENVVVWDIGMNVGMASLYFASRPNVRAVLGFEPFRPTFDAARRNAALNPELEAKIKLRNFGIAARACSAETEFDPEWKGGVGVNGICERLRKKIHLSGDSLRVERVQLLAADEVLQSIKSDYPECAIVAKIDCEGSEYEIIRCLHEKRLLGELSMMMIEWHDRGPQELETILHPSGFVTFSPAPASNGNGMLYAVAQNRLPSRQGAEVHSSCHGIARTVSTEAAGCQVKASRERHDADVTSWGE